MTLPSVLIGMLELAGLILINGLFVAAEYALVSIRKSRVEELAQAKKPGAATLLELKRNLDRSIAGSQMGITFASLCIGWLGGSVVSAAATQIFGALPWFVPPKGLAFALSFLLLSLTQVIIGEQIPKQIALRLPEQTIMRLSKPFRAFCWIMSPFISLMSWTAATAIKLFGIGNVQAQEQPLPSPDEFQILIEESEKAGTLGKQESSLLRRALELKALTVREVMVPKSRMDAIPESVTLPEVLALVTKTKHSKLPVYRNTRDGVIGILNTRDLFELWQTRLKIWESQTGSPVTAAPFKLSAYIRQAYFAPESMLASTLLEVMKARRLQMAVVVDEFGTTVGLITLEDLIEQLVGEIWDEYDTPGSNGIEILGPSSWRVPGEMTLFEFNKTFHAEVTCAMHCTTIAGAVIEMLDHQPTVGESVTMSGYKFTIDDMRGPAVTKLEVKRVPDGEGGATVAPPADAATASGAAAATPNS
ncbi:MAG TPA: hemolysin family protein [Planktothrix sp.]|jgi:CBS domain containing-hemolysin-like protein